MPAIRDRVVQGALTRILEPLFAADFHPGSYGYRPKQAAHEASQRGAEAILDGKTSVMALDLHASFDHRRHPQGLAKVARRVDDAAVMPVRHLRLNAAGQPGGPQGAGHSPLSSHLAVNEVAQMLARARAVTQVGGRTAVQDGRFADALVVRIGPHPRQRWRRQAVEGR